MSDMSGTRTNNEELNTLDCHFTWDIDKQLRDNQKTLSSLVKKLHNDIDIFEDERIPSYTFLAFLYTISETTGSSEHVVDLNRSLEAIEEAEKLWEDENIRRASGLKSDYVLRVNKLQILYKTGRRSRDIEDRLRQLKQEYENSEKKADIQFSLWCLRGLALQRVGPGKNCGNYIYAARLFHNASNYDLANRTWMYRRVVLLGRIRRFECNSLRRSSIYDFNTEERLWKTVLRAHPEDPFYNVQYANFLCDRKHDYCVETIWGHLEKGLSCTTASYLLISMCIKTLHQLTFLDRKHHKFYKAKQEEFLEVATKLDTYQDSGLLADIGKIYESTKNHEKAKEYYVKSIEAAPGNIHTQLKLIRLENDKETNMRMYGSLILQRKNDVQHLLLIARHRALYLLGKSQQGSTEDRELIHCDFRFLVKHDGLYKAECALVASKVLRFQENRRNNDTNIDSEYDLAWFYQNLFPEYRLFPNETQTEAKNEIKRSDNYRKMCIDICNKHRGNVKLGVLKIKATISLGSFRNANKLITEVRNTSSPLNNKINTTLKKCEAKILVMEINRMMQGKDSSEILFQKIKSLTDLGCADYIQYFINLVEQKCSRDPSFLASTKTLELLVRVEKVLEDQSLETLTMGEHVRRSEDEGNMQETLSNTFQAMITRSLGYHDELGLLQGLRKRRKDVYVSQDGHLAKDLINEARNILDVVHQKLGRALYSSNNEDLEFNYGFPMPIDTTTCCYENVNSRLKRILVDEQHLTDFANKSNIVVTCLFSFLCQEFNRNRDETEFWLEDWLQRKTADHDLIDLAQKSGQFVDKVTQKYSDTLISLGLI